MFLALLSGCSRGVEVASVDPNAGPVDESDFADVQPTTTEVDSLGVLTESEADEVALRDLHELSFNSLVPGGYQITGVFPAPDSVPFSTLPANRSGGGGPEALSGPAYDIEIESFADHTRVRYYVDYFTGRGRERFNVWLGRMSRYEGMIRESFRGYGLPEDMVYLALIESGFSNTAVSRARAVGMWQFMSYAARPYGLRVDSWVDERRDPYRATDAAARHLGDLNERFGSWYLAAAAYNGGAGRVSRGISRLGAVETSSDETFFALYDQRYIRRETRDYVPKLIAAAIIAKEPSRYGFEEIPSLSPLTFDEITVTDATGLDVLAGLADTTTSAVMELNPAYHRGATPPGETATVRVPRGTGLLVARRSAELTPEDRLNFLEHRVRNGETLGGIGLRYGVSVGLLRAANSNVHPRRLRIGSVLTIPVSAAARSGEARPVVSSRPTPARRPTGAGTRHTVSRGESLWVIARHYNTTIDALQELNGLSSGQVLRIGQQLLVGSAPPSHTVARGESLWVIGRRYGIPHGRIREWNGLPQNAVLRVGQTLRLTAP